MDVLVYRFKKYTKMQSNTTVYLAVNAVRYTYFSIIKIKKLL